MPYLVGLRLAERANLSGELDRPIVCRILDNDVRLSGQVTFKPAGYLPSVRWQSYALLQFLSLIEQT